MKVRLRIKEAAQERGIMNAYRLAQKLNKKQTPVGRLWKGELTKIGIQTIGELCEALDCQPGDLFEYRPSRANGNRPKKRS